GQQEEINKLRWELWLVKMKSEEHDTAVFTPASSGYSRIDAPSGTFLVAVTEFKPYANGYRVSLDVGNPSAARYKGAKLNVKWGKPFDPKANVTYENWEKSLRQADTTIQELRPATWNRVSVVLSPAVAEDTGYVQVSM